MLIIGTGVAGLSSALAAAAAGAEVTLVCEGANLAEFGGNTQLAQGGIAAAIGAGDDPAKHAHDTIAAGAGLVDLAAARALTVAGAAAVRGLIGAGFAVDRDTCGSPVLGMEGAHSEHRIVHAGEDRTGAALHAFLRAQVQRGVDAGRITLLTSHTVTELVLRDGAVGGAVLRDVSGAGAAVGVGARLGARSTAVSRFSPKDAFTCTADAVVLATGGYAGLYPRSTNAPGVRGDGILLAARAGALLEGLEFVQFHPTVIHGTGSLVSEAVRGAGAVLRDASGRNFMREAHPLGDLAPRDVVSREIHRVLRERGEEFVWLDATAIERSSPGALARRFPSITAAASAHGYDWTKDPLPVSPAAHYSMGGVATDLSARTSVPGLFAAGEAAATGVHGANRLASNSLLEGLAFGSRAGVAAVKFASGNHVWDPSAVALLEQDHLAVNIAAGTGSGTGSGAAAGAGSGAAFCAASCDPVHAGVHSPIPSDAVSRAIGSGLGIVRSASDFADAARVLRAHAGIDGGAHVGIDGGVDSGTHGVYRGTQFRSDAQLASLILAAAEARTESRGAHQRSDYPDTDAAQATRRGVRAVVAAHDSATTRISTSSHTAPTMPTRPTRPTSHAAPTHLKEPHPC